jgi:hypothetical protein
MVYKDGLQTDWAGRGSDPSHCLNVNERDLQSFDIALLLGAEKPNNEIAAILRI